MHAGDRVGKVVARLDLDPGRAVLHPWNLLDPFLAAPPQRIELQAWGVVLGASGHQTPHNHSAAWLSGVYYAQVPRVVSESRDEHAGWLEFRRPHPKYPCSVEPEVKAFQPSEGLIVNRRAANQTNRALASRPGGPGFAMTPRRHLAYLYNANNLPGDDPTSTYSTSAQVP